VISLRARGVRVIGVDRSRVRLVAASQLGCDAVIDASEGDVAAAIRDMTDGLGVAASIDAAGSDAALSAALRSTRPDGTVVVVAHHQEPLQLRSGHLIFGELRLTGSLIYDADDFRAVIDALTNGRIPTDDWTEVVELERVVTDGFDRLRAGEANKIVVRVAGDTPRSAM
jgi:threonine dehydrogenase-like Zn-dependent dehydrogenase